MLLFQTILVYTFLMCSMFYFSHKGCQSAKKSYQIIAILLFAIVLGLRYNVGVDWDNYRTIYENDLLNLSFPEMLDTRYELGFVTLVYICHLFSIPTYIFFIIIAFVQIFFLYKALEDDDKIIPYVYLAFFLTGIAIQGFCNVMRHNIAFVIFLYATRYIRSHKVLPYILLCILASSFHKASLIVIPLYFLWQKRSSIFTRPLVQTIIYIGCIILSFNDYIQQLFSNFTDLYILLGFDGYIDTILDYSTYGHGTTVIVYWISSLVIIQYSNKIKTFYDNRMVNIFYDLFFIGICSSCVFMGNMLFSRASLFFTNMLFIIYGYTIYYFLKATKSNVNIISFTLVILSLIASYSSMIYHSPETTDSYVHYFQEDLHPLKDRQREIHLETRNFGNIYEKNIYTIRY